MSVLVPPDDVVLSVPRQCIYPLVGFYSHFRLPFHRWPPSSARGLGKIGPGMKDHEGPARLIDLSLLQPPRVGVAKPTITRLPTTALGYHLGASLCVCGCLGVRDVTAAQTVGRQLGRPRAFPCFSATREILRAACHHGLTALSCTCFGRCAVPTLRHAVDASTVNSS